MFKKLFGGSTDAPAAKAAPFDARWWNVPTLAAGKYQEVVGESHYQPAIKAALDAYGRTQLAQLVREPRNKHDRNAVAVRLAGQTVGYLPRDEALDYQAVLVNLGGTATSRATVTGGWNQYESFGVVLHCDPEPFDPSVGFLGGERKVALTTLKAAKPAALDAVGGGALATLTVDDAGAVWAFVGQTAVGKMAKARSDDYSAPTRACAKVGVAPTCMVYVDSKDDGSVKFAAYLMPVNDHWATLQAP